MRQLTCRILSFVFFVLLCAIASHPAHAQQVDVSWTGGAGEWFTPPAINWNPAVVPDNTATTTYSVNITAPNSNVDLGGPVTVDNLTLGAGDQVGGVGGILTLASGASSNNGTLSFGDAPRGNAGIIVNSGASLSNGGTITEDYAALTNNGAMSNTGTINQIASGYFDNTGTFTNVGNYLLNSVDDPGGFTNSGLFSNSGNVNIAPAFLGSSFSNTGTLNNTGTMAIYVGCSNCLVSASNSGIINNSGTLNLTAGSGGSFTNTGTFTISSSGLVTASSANYIQTAGSTIVNGTFTATSGAALNVQGGTLSGTGTINSNVTMAGTMMPGDKPGTLTITGNYEQMSGGIFDELMSSTSQSLLDVSGNVMLDPGADLEITLLNGFDPLGQTFDIMNFSSLTGEFANGSSFTDDGFLWDITYLQNQIDVTAVKGSVQAPEPGTFAFLAMGVAGLFWLRRKRSKHSVTFLRGSIL